MPILMWYAKIIRLGVLGVLGGIPIMSSGDQTLWAMAEQKPRAVVALVCVPEALDPQIPEPEKLCLAVQNALQNVAVGQIVRQVADESQAPARAGDMLVRLFVERSADISLNGRIEWRTAPETRMTSGPEVQFTVMDVALSSAQYSDFAANLLRASNLEFKQ